MPFDATPAREVPQATPAEAETNPHPIYSLAGLIWWLERMPADEKYNWLNCERCCVGQYLASRGALSKSRHGDDYLKFIRAIHGHIPKTDVLFATEPTTFGEALKRARLAAGGGE